MSGNKNLQYMEISKIGTVISGSTPKTKVKEFWDGNITWLTPLDLKNGRKYIFNGARRITEKAIKSTSLKLVPKGTVLLTSRAPIGKIAIAGKELCTNQGFKNIICSEQVNNEYLYYYLRSKTEFLNNLGRGATFKEISKKIVESIIIPLPPLETQKKIADILDNIQKFITLRKKQIEKWDEFVKGVFLEMFGDPVRNTKSWEKVGLYEIVDVRDGTHDSPKYVTKGYPLVTSKNIINGRLDLTNIRCISEEDYLEINKRSKVDTGDIIMPMIGTIGNPIIIKKTPNFAIKNVALIKFSGDEKIKNIYLLFLLKSCFLNYVLAKNKRGGTQQ